jgi:hypothetical protein
MRAEKGRAKRIAYKDKDEKQSKGGIVWLYITGNGKLFTSIEGKNKEIMSCVHV